MIVRVCSKDINFFAISAHAPYAGCKTDNPEDWWISFSKTCKAVCGKGVPIICGIDGNVSTYASGCDFIGKIGIREKLAPPNFGYFCDFVVIC